LRQRSEAEWINKSRIPYPTGDIASKKEVIILNQVKDNKITSVISDGSLLYHSDMEKMISFNCEKK
jgi:hypothetical protein